MEEKAVARVGGMWKIRVREEKARSCWVLRVVSRVVRVVEVEERWVVSVVLLVSLIIAVSAGLVAGEEEGCSVISRVLQDCRALWVVGFWMLADVMW